ncbi:hypothetical protein BDW75DRAFT_206405 [Aspergillus navahoensis]
MRLCCHGMRGSLRPANYKLQPATWSMYVCMYVLAARRLLVGRQMNSEYRWPGGVGQRNKNVRRKDCGLVVDS